MNRSTLHLLAWLLLGLVAVFTLSPIGLRPHSGFSATLERFAAFGLLGLVFSIAYPRHFGWGAGVLLGAAVGLEALQFVIDGRHPGLRDLAAKLAGGGAGLGAGWLLLRLRRHRSGRRPDG